jgi:hypothetical protein
MLMNEGARTARVILTKQLLKELPYPRDPAWVAVKVVQMIRSAPLKGHMASWVRSEVHHAKRVGMTDRNASIQKALEDFVRNVVAPVLAAWTKTHGKRGNEWQNLDHVVLRILAKDHGVKLKKTQVQAPPRRLKLVA